MHDTFIGSNGAYRENSKMSLYQIISNIVFEGEWNTNGSVTISANKKRYTV